MEVNESDHADHITDLSPGTVLKVVSTGRVHEVVAEDNMTVAVETPTGRVSVTKSEIRRDVVGGKIEVGRDE